MSLFRKTLERIFREPIVVLMLGEWRLGKTDASLLIGFLLKKWGVVQRLGSNIFTYNNPEIEELTSLEKTLSWLHSDKSEKLFILDEALKHAYRRKAMSALNIEIITELLPELSKGHGRIIACSQIEKLDSDLIHPAFCRARIIKLSKKTMLVYSKYWRGARRFTNLPKSPIRFDPDKTAKFILTKMSKMQKNVFKGRLYEIARSRLQGMTYSDIADKLNTSNAQLVREINKILKFYVSYVDSQEDPREFVNKTENEPSD